MAATYKAAAIDHRVRVAIRARERGPRAALADDNRVSRLQDQVVLGLLARQQVLVGQLDDLLSLPGLAVDDDPSAPSEGSHSAGERDPLQEAHLRAEQDRPGPDDLPREIGLEAVDLLDRDRDRGGAQELLEPPLNLDRQLLRCLTGGVD